MTKNKLKKVDIYDIGDGLELLNVCIKNEEGKLEQIDTFVGNHDRQEYVSVGTAKELSDPGTVFSYASYVKMQKMNIKIYKEFYRDNLNGKVYTEDGGCYRVRN